MMTEFWDISQNTWLIHMVSRGKIHETQTITKGLQINCSYEKNWYEGIRMTCDALCIAVWHNWLICNAVVKFSVFIYATCTSLSTGMSQRRQQRIKKYSELVPFNLGSLCQEESIITNIEFNYKEHGCNICFIHTSPLASGEACYTGLTVWNV